jgi:hypothetical protein
MINFHPQLFTRLMTKDEKKERWEEFGERDKKKSGLEGSQAVPAHPSGRSM